MRLGSTFEAFRPGPVEMLFRAFEQHGHQLSVPHTPVDEAAHRRLEPRVQMADRFETDDSLRPKRAVEKILTAVALRCRARQALPPEMPIHELVGFQHARALADRDESLVEGDLQRALGRLAARPFVLLFNEHVVDDVAHRQGAMLADTAQHPAHVTVPHGGEPGAEPLPVAPHVAHEERHIFRGDVGERMRPVFEYRLVDALRLVQVLAPVIGDPRVKDVVVAALDDMDRVDLHIAEVFHGRGRPLRAGPEGRRFSEPLSVEPDLPRAGFV